MKKEKFNSSSEKYTDLSNFEKEIEKAKEILENAFESFSLIYHESINNYQEDNRINESLKKAREAIEILKIESEKEISSSETENKSSEEN